MTIRLITGPPGAGKNTYVEKHKKDGDVVVDFDVMRETFPHLTLDQLRDVREIAEDAAKAHNGDAWVIRCIPEPEKRTEIATKLGAEVVVIETPADVAKERVKKRNRNPERNDEVFAAIDNWWDQYGVVESHLIVRPDTGQPLSDRKKKMPDLEEKSGTESDKGFPAETKIVDMTAEEQAAYWKFQSRKHENEKNALRTAAAKPAAKPAADDNDAKPEGNAPIDAAELRKQILAEIKREQAPELVRSSFKAHIGDRLPEATRDALLEDLNTAKYVKEDGSVDTDAIKARADVLAPATEERQIRKTRTHQGNRKRENPSSVQSGRDLFEAEAKKNRRS